MSKLIIEEHELPYQVAEQIKTLRTNLTLSGDNMHYFMVTSCLANEGKSSICYELTRSFADLGKTAVYIDTDLRKSVFHRRVKEGKIANGLTNYLAGQCNLEDILYYTQDQNVSVIPAGPVPPNPSELLASGSCEDGSGILELHPDGYGFLRAPSFLPSTKDIYVSMAQIRRFGLRTGDYVEGKIRPQREGDKYSALLYISTVNGVPEEEAFSRPAFDELTPVYPTRRISLEMKDGANLPDMRLIDLIAPIGFGQRGLVLCPPDTGKTKLMRDFARVISKNYPDAEVLMLLIDVNPEDATLMREAVPCTVLASSFDQAPEAHLRLSEIVLERAMRLVEQKKDVILLVDSLTRLAKIYTTAAVQQGRSLPGMVNPASLFRAKRMFGAARSCKEGGSLTVIAAMDISTGSKVDDSVVEEFKGTANMELTLDISVARAGVSPALNLQNSYTKNADILLSDREKEGLSLIRTMLGSSSSAVAIPQLLSMMEKAETNEDLLLKMKDWFALMNR